MSNPDFTRIALSLDMDGSARARDARVTSQGLSIDSAYRAQALDGLDFIHGLPGFAPFVRGISTTMYAAEPWAIRPTQGGTDVVAGGDDPVAVLKALRVPATGILRYNDLCGLMAGAQGQPQSVLKAGVDALAWMIHSAPAFGGLELGVDVLHAGDVFADVELAYAVAAGVAYVRAAVAAGLDIDAVATRLSVSFGTGADYFAEVAKLRAVRLLWAEAMADEGATHDAALALGIHCQARDHGMNTQDNPAGVTRAVVECLAAVGGQAQSIDTGNAVADGAGRMAALTAAVAQDEAGLTRVIDPWGGSHYVEHLTQTLAHKARGHLMKIDQAGGVVAALETGLIQVMVSR